MSQKNQTIPPGRFPRFTRMKRGLTQKEAAKKIGIVASYLSRLEKDKCSVPMLLFKKVAEAYSMTRDEQHQLSDLLISQPRVLSKAKEPIMALDAAEALSALLKLSPEEFSWVVTSANAYRDLFSKKSE